jgi:orotidine-5'-phosphate decarboxylase
MKRSLLACVAALAVVACAGPMTSTAVLQERKEDGGSVRIVCPGYPPDADTQAKASAEMAKVCDLKQWKVVGIVLTDVQGPSSPPCGVSSVCTSGPGPRHQQVDLTFVCLAR